MSVFINEEVKRWFIELIAQHPDYLYDVFLPEIEKSISKGQFELYQSMRKNDLADIKYRMGWFDGIKEVSNILSGLKLSYGKEPIEAGLMSRIFSRVRNSIPIKSG